MLANLKRYAVRRPVARMFSTGIRSQYLIETDQLEKNLDSYKIVNASWYMPNVPIIPWEEHIEGRITADTIFFDHDKIAIQNEYPHTMPTLDIFTENMKRLQI